MKKILAWILVLALIAVASVIATVAYLTDVDSEENIFTIGNIDIDLLEYERVDTETADAGAVVQEFNDYKPLLPAVIAKDFNYTPGDTYVDWDSELNNIKPNTGYTSPIWDPAKINNEVDKMVFVKNTGDYSAYVRIYFAFEAGNFDTFDEFQKKIHVNLNDTATEWKWEWIPFVGVNETTGTNYFVAKATYQKELAPGAITEISLSQVALDSTAENDDVAAFAGKYEVKVCAQGIQSAGFDAPHQALVAGFGRGVPFDDIYIEGNTMKNALHYLNGDLEGEDITNKVTSITFGLNNDYPEIADNYQGTPINDEQDYYVNVHYVPEGENFKLYVLADGPIYTPVDSTELFYKMQYVETIDMANLNTSRTVYMSWMLGSCSKLAELDLSTWDVSNVINMNGLLYGCSSLTEISFDGWETTSLDSLQNFLRNCSSLKTADVSDLDTETVTNMHRTFYGCGALESIIGLDQWDTSNVYRMDQMFLGVGEKSGAMTEIDISNFDSSSLALTSFMFSGCKNLKAVRFGENWDMAEVTTATNMFNGCTNLQTIYVVKDWNTSKLTGSAGMFTNCTSLVGGNGTVFNSAIVDKTYARIDTPEAPGYLTYKAAESTNP